MKQLTWKIYLDNKMKNETQGDLGLSVPQITLLHGDCLEEMKHIPDNSVDMVLTDPP